jgi:hypothetical protein
MARWPLRTAPVRSVSRGGPWYRQGHCGLRSVRILLGLRGERQGLHRSTLETDLRKQPHFPTATECSVQIDQTLGDLTSGSGCEILNRRYLGLRDIDRDEIRFALFVLFKGNLSDNLGGLRRCVQMFRPLMALQESDDPVLGLPAGFQDFLLISESSLLELRIACPDTVDEPAIVQHVPAESRANGA